MNMKNKRISAKATEHKILGEQAQKLKDKLDHLKEQIKQKKQQKQMNKTSNSIYSTKSNTRPSSRSKMNATQSSFSQKSSLQQVLAQLKIQNIEHRLKEKNIVTFEQFQSIEPEDIDQWKEIPVGYRIKMKKFIQKSQSKINKIEQKIEKMPANQQRKVEEQLPNIQSIIENRKNQHKFIPIIREKDIESEEEYVQQLQEEQQQKMMISIMEAFRGRASSLKGKKKNDKKKVHWSPEVEQMERNHNNAKKYPKQTVSKSLFDLKNEQGPQIDEQKEESPIKPKINSFFNEKQFPDYKYCWICLKKVEKSLEQDSKDFCSQKCFSIYQKTVDQNLLDQVYKLEDEPSLKIVEEEQFDLNFDII